MHNFKEIEHFCYYDPDNNDFIVGVSPEELLPLSNFPFKKISYELAEPFYLGNRSYGGPYKILSTVEGSKIIKEDPLTQLTKTKQNHIFYKIPIKKEIKNVLEYDFILEATEDPFFKISKVSISTTSNLAHKTSGVKKIFVTPKNNPFFLDESIIINLSTNDINYTFDHNNESYFVHNSLGNIVFIPKISNKPKKPFIIYNILELDIKILTANTLNIDIYTDFNEKISVKELIENEEYEKSFTLDSLIDSFYKLSSYSELLNDSYEEKNISLNDLPTLWINHLLSETYTSKILYNKSKIIVISSNPNEKIYITEKNNPFKILNSTTGNTSILDNIFNVDFDAYIMFNDELTKIETTKMKN